MPDLNIENPQFKGTFFLANNSQSYILKNITRFSMNFHKFILAKFKRFFLKKTKILIMM